MASIVQLCEWFLPHKGGVETHVAEVSSELSRLGHSVTIITQQDEDSQPLEEKISPSVTVIRIPHFQIGQWKHKQPLLYKIRLWQWMLRHARVLLSAKIVHVHDVGWWLLPFFPVLDYWVTFHGWETHYPVDWMAKLQRYIVSAFARGRVHVGAWIQEFYWDKPDMVMYGAPTLFTDKKIKKVALPKKPLQIVFIGRLSKDTGVPLFITALKELKKKISCTVVWVGDGELREECSGVGTVTGMVDAAELAKQLQKSAVVCAGSYLSILDAQAAGKPVVTVYSHKLKRRYFETLPTVEAIELTDSADQVTSVVYKLLTDEQQYNSKASHGQKLAIKLSWRDVAQSYLRLWRVHADV